VQDGKSQKLSYDTLMVNGCKGGSLGGVRVGRRGGRASKITHSSKSNRQRTVPYTSPNWSASSRRINLADPTYSAGRSQRYMLSDMVRLRPLRPFAHIGDGGMRRHEGAASYTAHHLFSLKTLRSRPILSRDFTTPWLTTCRADKDHQGCHEVAEH
jgi:hypothetical protein